MLKTRGGGGRFGIKGGRYFGRIGPNDSNGKRTVVGIAKQKKKKI